MRKFAFINSAGERYPLNGERSVYLSDPTGLGYSLSPAYADLSGGFFLLVGDQAEPQTQMTFTLTFTGSAPYAQYAAFANWMASAGRLTLAYSPDADREYYRDVNISFVQKTELNAVRWLEVPVSLYGLTPWFLPLPTELELGADDDDNVKRYDYVYDDVLRYGSDSTSAFSGLIVNGGHVPAAMLLTYRGGIINPQIRLVGTISGKTHGVCSIAVALPDTDTLLVSTKATDSYVRRRNAQGVENDLLDVLDLSLNPFFRIPVDEPCILSVEADSAISGTASLEIYYYYRTV